MFWFFLWIINLVGNFQLDSGHLYYFLIEDQKKQSCWTNHDSTRGLIVNIYKGWDYLTVTAVVFFVMSISLKAPSLPGTRSSANFSNRLVTGRAAFSPVQELRPSSIHGTTFPRRKVSFRTRTVVQSVLETERSTKTEKPVRLVALVGKGEVSPLKSTSWHEVMLHTVSPSLLSLITLLTFCNLILQPLHLH